VGHSTLTSALPLAKRHSSPPASHGALGSVRVRVERVPDPYVPVAEASFSRTAPRRKAPRRKSTEIQEKPARVSRAKAEPAETVVNALRMVSKRWASGVLFDQEEQRAYLLK